MSKNVPFKRRQSFTYHAPAAISVQLAGDFTDWDKNPIPLQKRADGTWHAMVELAPGAYRYRFLVDGGWHDDPECTTFIPNPYGSRDAVRQVDRDRLSRRKGSGTDPLIAPQIATWCLAFALGLPVAATAFTGCTTSSRYERSTGEYIDDKTLASKVRGALHDNAEYKFNDVIVASYKSTVQLSGFVNTSDQKRVAGQIAEKMQGVKAVQNNISVKE